MMINKLLLKNKKITVIVLIIFIGMSIETWWQHNQSEQQKFCHF